MQQQTSNFMKSIKLHKQSNDYSCGPASLRMVLSHFEVHKSEEELIDLTGAKAGVGCEPSDIVRAAEGLGFKAKYIPTSSLEEVKKMMDAGSMVIVDWFSPEVNGHYSVVAKITDTQIILANPTHGGYTTMTRNAFLNRWFEIDEYPPKDVSKFFLREAISIEK